MKKQCIVLSFLLVVTGNFVKGMEEGSSSIVKEVVMDAKGNKLQIYTKRVCLPSNTPGPKTYLTTSIGKYLTGDQKLIGKQAEQMNIQGTYFSDKRDNKIDFTPTSELYQAFEEEYKQLKKQQTMQEKKQNKENISSTGNKQEPKK